MGRSLVAHPGIPMQQILAAYGTTGLIWLVALTFVRPGEVYVQFVDGLASVGLPEYVRIATRRPEENDRLLAALREMRR
jgi:histidinol-phosphate/aromatic aminotransferase/cobyric acid decarboxylase-like protein